MKDEAFYKLHARSIPTTQPFYSSFSFLQSDSVRKWKLNTVTITKLSQSILFFIIIIYCR